jgi:hypothetical protein
MIKTIFFISDLLFPMWWIVLMVVCMRKGLSSWKAWGIASTFCLTQAYLVAKFIGWNFGGYFLFFIASMPFLLLSEVAKRESIYNSQSEFWFWIIPPVVLIVIPMLILFFISKSKHR